MTSVRRIQLVHNAGEPDSVLARRIDVVSAACAVVDGWSTYGTTTDHESMERLENKLVIAVRRYKRALKSRRKAT